MKKIVCELCAGTTFSKLDGMFVCQGCGTKFTVQEAKGMIQDIPAEDDNELRKLYELARRFGANYDAENALPYYQSILRIAPTDWEANFYTVYFQALNCTLGGIESAAYKVGNSEIMVLNLIKENVTDLAERESAIVEVANKLIKMSSLFYNETKRYYDSLSYFAQSSYMSEMINNCMASADILYNFGDFLIELFGNEYVKNVAVPCWKVAIDEHRKIIKFLANKPNNKKFILGYADKVKRYDPSYETPYI